MIIETSPLSHHHQQRYHHHNICTQEDVLRWSRSRRRQNCPDKVPYFFKTETRLFVFLKRFDAKTMVDNPKVSASTGMVDDGTGVKEVGGFNHLTFRNYPALIQNKIWRCIG